MLHMNSSTSKKRVISSFCCSICLDLERRWVIWDNLKKTEQYKRDVGKKCMLLFTSDIKMFWISCFSPLPICRDSQLVKEWTLRQQMSIDSGEYHASHMFLILNWIHWYGQPCIELCLISFLLPKLIYYLLLFLDLNFIFNLILLNCFFFLCLYPNWSFWFVESKPMFQFSLIYSLTNYNMWYLHC